MLCCIAIHCNTLQCAIQCIALQCYYTILQYTPQDPGHFSKASLCTHHHITNAHRNIAIWEVSYNAPICTPLLIALHNVQCTTLPPFYPLLLLLLLLHHLIPMMGTPNPFSPLPAKLVLVGKGGERPLIVLLPPLPPSHLVLSSSSSATLLVLASSSDCEQDRCRALLHLDLVDNDFVAVFLLTIIIALFITTMWMSSCSQPVC